MDYKISHANRIHLCHLKQHVQMVAYVIWVWLILQSCCAYWKCNKILTWKGQQFSDWPQEERTHNRWATRTLNRPHPSALITVNESHGTRPIKPHYLDRENMREQDHWSIKGGGRRDGYHSWGGWHFWRSSDVWRWHRFVIRQCFVSIWRQAWPKPWRIDHFPNEHRP